MPIMVRPNNLGTKIAYKVLGTPPNIKFKRSKQQEYVNKQLLSQETSRER